MWSGSFTSLLSGKASLAGLDIPQCEPYRVALILSYPFPYSSDIAYSVMASMKGSNVTRFSLSIGLWPDCFLGRRFFHFHLQLCQ